MFLMLYVSMCDNIIVRYPDRITLIRGNHESRQITQVHKIKYSIPFNETMKVEHPNN